MHTRTEKLDKSLEHVTKLRQESGIYEIEMSEPGRNYRERLICIATLNIYKGIDSKDVKRSIEDRRLKEGDVVAEDYTKICRMVWKLAHD